MIKWPIIFILSSCSLIQLPFLEGEYGQWEYKQEYEQLSNEDYLDHLVHIGKNFKDKSKDQVITLPKHSAEYLKRLTQKILINNELLFVDVESPEIIIVNDSLPFYFSIPKRTIFLSSDLILNYVRNEGDLVSIFAYEMVRCYRNIYRKNILIPKGSIEKESIIPFLKIPLSYKAEINKWVYTVIKRAGYDPYVYLTWLQQLNSNNMKFALHLMNTDEIVQEEYLFKNHMLNIDALANKRKIKINSSIDFYKFINDFKSQREGRRD